MKCPARLYINDQIGYSILATDRLKQCSTSHTYDKNRVYSFKTLVERHEHENDGDEAGTDKAFTFTHNTREQHRTTANARLDVNNQDTDRIENTQRESRQNEADHSEKND
ncbi:hypothetical protein DPMN_144782 [Dreissena polymorpha]|uniref:Uncharacterized protein n=1 Tax=Dreissena polymorpha TaxID=45954 RepID=A0A9D4J0D1_DREPO|nr:hypothetical protein DPMN_144782 [Dreissena polymorpha]